MAGMSDEFPPEWMVRAFEQGRIVIPPLEPFPYEFPKGGDYADCIAYAYEALKARDQEEREQ